jgi:porin
VAGGLVALAVPSALHAQPKIDSLAGPDSTPALLAADDQERDTVLGVNLLQSLQSWSDWKASIKDRTGLDFGLRLYCPRVCRLTKPGRGHGRHRCLSSLREWELFGRGTKNTGTLLFKVDNRHRLDTVPVKDFAGNWDMPVLSVPPTVIRGGG